MKREGELSVRVRVEVKASTAAILIVSTSDVAVSRKSGSRSIGIPIPIPNRLEGQSQTGFGILKKNFNFVFFQNLLFLAPSYDLPVRQLYDIVLFSTSFEA